MCMSIDEERMSGVRLYLYSDINRRGGLCLVNNIHTSIGVCVAYAVSY